MDIKEVLKELNFINNKSSNGYTQHINIELNRIISFTEEKMTIFDHQYYIKYDGKIPEDIIFLIKLIENTNG